MMPKLNALRRLQEAEETLTELHAWLKDQRKQHLEILKITPFAVDQQQAQLAYQKTLDWLETKRSGNVE